MRRAGELSTSTSQYGLRTDPKFATVGAPLIAMPKPASSSASFSQNQHATLSKRSLEADEDSGT